MNKQKILVIDDEFPIRYMVEHQLKRRGFDVISASDGPSGLKAAFTYRPDLVVLDIMMPRMDGFAVCEELREHPETAAVPVIFLTACETKEHKMRAFEVGADDYLIKPFQPDELLAHIAAILRRTQPAPIAGGGQPGSVVSLFSPKGGVGTTTLAIQLGEAVALREDRQVLLMDLNLPLGGVAPALNLYTNYHSLGLLSQPASAIDMPTIMRYAQRHRASLWVSPAPGELGEPGQPPSTDALVRTLSVLADSGYQTILDLGSTMNKLTLAAMRESDVVYLVTSGQAVANKLLNAFLSAAPKLGLESRRLLPVINELHGPADDSVTLTRIPAARIPHASERTRTRLWLRDQGLQKLVSVML
ncbi:MAG: response regulator [Anaerolineales bacterium]|nr:response regulator [Anaerolineales bacterium]